MLTAKTLPNGPLLLTGAFTVNDTTSDRGALCRCGESKAKPFCDGAHRGCGFADAGAPAADAEIPAVADADTVLTLIPNGPVQCAGAIEVQAADGTVVRRAEKLYLCRCGASKNKPYCDGAHRTAGFVAP